MKENTIVRPTHGTHPGRKIKKSFTLSVESVKFLDGMRKVRRAPSVSSVLEDILQAVRSEQDKATLERAVMDYYASISREEAEEQAKWGDLAMREFPDESR